MGDAVPYCQVCRHDQEGFELDISGTANSLPTNPKSCILSESSHSPHLGKFANLALASIMEKLYIYMYKVPKQNP